MKKVLKKFKIFLIVIPTLVIIQGISAFYLHKQSLCSEIKFGEDSVITLYSAVGSKKLVKIDDKFDKDGSKSKTFVYKTSTISADELNTYIAKLKSQGFVFTNNSDMYTKQLAKASKELNKSIIVNLEYNRENKYFRAKYSKISGSFIKSDIYY